ncbi:hypothetical protein TrVE_jg9221 [Triparma verrucosa]|uniref:SET domain-containing protein n=1 Tax=Triparma verrucosa TaxID=1606542 RepID=A0A9W7CLB6_9STRA|nr:hypothetical protein TrVE_jg9221 [Triparma verrucosa]
MPIRGPSSSAHSSLIGARISKAFGQTLYDGTIVSADKVVGKDGGAAIEESVLHVKYDDGDEEDLSIDEAKKLVKSFENKAKAKSPKPTKKKANKVTKSPKLKPKAKAKAKPKLPKPAATATTAKATAKATATTTLLASGHNWKPKVIAGQRRPGSHGCVKCRYRPSGCKGCIANDEAFWASNGGVQEKPAQPAALVCMPDRLVMKELTYEFVEEEEQYKWYQQLTKLRNIAEIVSDERQSHRGGYGLIAKKNLKAGSSFVDPTAILVQRPSDYAKAHLGEYDYIAFGASNFIQLRDEYIPHCAFTYRLNEANHTKDDGQVPCVKWSLNRKSGGRAQLGWEITRDVVKGEELLGSYNTADTPSQRSFVCIKLAKHKADEF